MFFKKKRKEICKKLYQSSALHDIQWETNYYREKDLKNFYFASIIKIGNYQGEHYYAVLETSPYLGEYIIIFASSEDNLEESFVSKMVEYNEETIKAESLKDTMSTIHCRFKNVCFPFYLSFKNSSLSNLKTEMDKYIQKRGISFCYYDNFLDKLNVQKV